MGLKIKLLPAMLILAGLGISRPPATYADTYTFSCPESSIKGAISYIVVGTYHALYKECSGKIVYDSLHRQIKSVKLSIAAVSIKSNCQWCDDVVRSKRVFDVSHFPFITFESRHIENKEGGWWVDGTLNLHGMAQNMRFPFALEGQRDDTLLLKGTWIFNRKKFNVVWNRILDHGGVVVGDYVMVDWQVMAHKKG